MFVHNYKYTEIQSDSRPHTVAEPVEALSEPVAVQLNKGSTLSSVNTDYVIPGTHHFLYWSTTKASSAAALKGRVDLDVPITQNMILYGIYAPILATDKAPEVDFTDIEAGLDVYFQSCDVFSFGNNEVDFNLFLNVKKGDQIVSSTLIQTNLLKDEIGSHSENIGGQPKDYLLASLNVPIPSLPSGTYTLSITNLFEGPIDVTGSSFTVSGAPAKATGESVDVEDSYAKVTWNYVPGTTYTVNAKEGSATVATKTNCVNSATFYGLTNGTAYTFEIITENAQAKNNTTTTSPYTPAITQQTPEWVLALYMDGDNDLHDYLFQDLNEIEYGLWLIENDDTIKANYTTITVNSVTVQNAVKAVALWDGWTGNSEKNPYWQTGPDSCLYELGPEESSATQQGDSWIGNQVIGDTASEYLVFDNLRLSKETKNLSYTARDWLLNNQDINTITNLSSGEVNMGSKETLVNFLTWIKERYAPTKGIILQFSDHGGGPRDAPNYVIMPNGTAVNLDQSGRKALCWDEGSDDDFLKTQDVSDALNEALGTTGLKSINAQTNNSLILMDVCLGASIEDAYQFKDYADYMVASPNTIPGYGMNYIQLMQAFTTSATMESIGKHIIADYAKFYEHYGWNSIANKQYKKTYSQLTDDEKDILDKKWAGFYGVSTLSLIKLSEINTVAGKINDLTEKLNELHTQSNLNYLVNFRKDNLSLLEQKYRDTSLCYKGSFNYLYDIGKLTDAILMDSATNPAAINTAATAVQTALKDAIVSSWRDTFLQSRSGDNSASMYSYLQSETASYEFTNNYYGLTIAGYAYKYNDNHELILPGTVYTWYINDLKFGKDIENWSDFLVKIRDLQVE